MTKKIKKPCTKKTRRSRGGNRRRYGGNPALLAPTIVQTEATPGATKAPPGATETPASATEAPPSATETPATSEAPPSATETPASSEASDSSNSESNIFHRYFSKSYDEAREKFVRLCKNHKLETSEIQIPCDYDDNLTINTGILWGNKKQVFLHISGTHGVEAYAGSAIQIYLIERMVADGIISESYDGPTIIFVHCLNPYGMKYGRRFNEDNIDLNRNYCTEEEFKQLTDAPPTEVYSDMNSWLNPEEDRTTCTLTMGEKIKMAYFIAKFGKSDIKQKVVGGQYKYPKGIFYGGTKVANSHRLLTEFLKKTMPENVEKLAILDVHTGIGPMGIDTLLCNGPKEYTQLSDVTNHYDHIQVRDPEKSISYKIHGNTINSYKRELAVPNTLVAVQEFGTYPEIDVVIKIRGESSVYFWTKKTQPDIASLSQKLLDRECKLRDVFCIYSLGWQNSVITRGAIVFNQFNTWLGSKYKL